MMRYSQKPLYDESKRSGESMFELLMNVAVERLFPKGAYLFHRGDTNSSLFLIQKGLIKNYYETRDGKQFVKSFIQEGGFIASMRAVVAGEPSAFSAVCLEQCQVLEVTKPQMDQLLAQKPEFVEQLNAMLLQLAAKKEQREYELLCLSARERCARLYEAEPGLVARLSQQDIARYLGIDPVSLSRIRKKGLNS